jgi:hypothetical protein
VTSQWHFGMRLEVQSCVRAGSCHVVVGVVKVTPDTGKKDVLEVWLGAQLDEKFPERGKR